MGAYFIKDDYEHRTENATLEEEPGEYWTDRRIWCAKFNQYSTYVEAARVIREHNLKSVMDVGCGIGWKLTTLVAPLADKVVGVEQRTTADVAKRLNPGPDYIVMDLEDQDEEPAGQFDLVMSVDVIEHLLDPDHLLRFMRAHCHDDSYVVISTPERDVRRGKDNKKSPKAEHVREWNQAELKAYLEASGFEVVEHVLRPGFRIGWSMEMLRERLRLLRKGISYHYSQIAICRVAKG